MLIGYARVSKADSSQVADLQHDALVRAGVAAKRIYEDRISGKRDDRPNLEACLKALRKGDVPVVWKLDRLCSDEGPSAACSSSDGKERVCVPVDVELAADGPLALAVDEDAAADFSPVLHVGVHP